jgi:hypothetical protein
MFAAFVRTDGGAGYGRGYAARRRVLTALRAVRLLTVSLLLAVVGSGQTAGQDRGGEQSSLTVTVYDAAGALVVGATVRLKPSGGAESALVTGARGEVSFTGLKPGAYALSVEARGFAPQTLSGVALKPGANPLQVRLDVAAVNEEVTVKRDVREERTDFNGAAFSTLLTQEQIAALPDDPEEFDAVLREIAGPGAVIRVNGFTADRLPPKSQIREIRFRLNPYAAENREAGSTGIDVFTKPGTDSWHGSFNFGFRDESLGARNAFAPRRGPEQYSHPAFTLDGPLWRQHTSLFLAAEASDSYDSKTIFAALPDGRFSDLVRVPRRTTNFSARVEHALSRYHTLRAEYQRNTERRDNLGVGDFDLPDRAYAKNFTEHLLRLSDTGPLSPRLVNEARLQARWQSASQLPVSDEPAIIVLNAFNRGGAQLRSSRRDFDLDFEDYLSFGIEAHMMKAGVLFQSGRRHSDESRNTAGTFIFSSLDAFRANRPATFTRRAGDTRVDLNDYQFDWFWQDDYRVRKNLSLSFGVRSETQSSVGDRNNFAPRFGLAWSPFKDGKTTVRAGAGIFYSTLPEDTYEQALRFEGGQQDTVVRLPGFPDPFVGGTPLALPPSRTQLAADLLMPYIEQASVGVERELTKRLFLRTNYMFQRGVHLLRGRNINAPLAPFGRPDLASGNVTQVESSANSTVHTFSVNLSPGQNGFSRRFYWLVNYSFWDVVNESDGGMSLPVDNYNLKPERGPALGSARHRLFAFANLGLWNGLRLGATLRANSATPYNITTGFDDNGDTVINDRPNGVGRNSARGAGLWDVGARLSWGFGFGTRPPAEGQGRVTVTSARSDGDVLGALSGPQGSGKRYRVQFYLQVYNLLNHANKVGFTGVETSPFFGQATAALPARRIESGLRFSF